MRLLVSSFPTNLHPALSNLATRSGLTSYLCLWRSSMNCWELYSFAVLHSSVWNMVRREPRRIVPPICVVEPSGMKITAGSGQFGTISVECAFFMSNIFRAYSITAACKPRQMPRNGTLFSLAYFAVRILPSVPRSPNPPGTRIPSTLCTFAHASACPVGSSARVESSSMPASTHTTLSFRSEAIAECIKALVTER